MGSDRTAGRKLASSYCQGACFGTGFLSTALCVAVMFWVLWCYWGLSVVQLSDSQRRGIYSSGPITRPPVDRTGVPFVESSVNAIKPATTLTNSNKGVTEVTPTLDPPKDSRRTLAKGDFADRNKGNSANHTQGRERGSKPQGVAGNLTSETLHKNVSESIYPRRISTTAADNHFEGNVSQKEHSSRPRVDISPTQVDKDSRPSSNSPDLGEKNSSARNYPGSSIPGRDEIQSSRRSDDTYRDRDFDREYPRGSSRGRYSDDEDDSRRYRDRYNTRDRDRGRDSEDKLFKGDARVYYDLIERDRYPDRRPIDDDRYDQRRRGDDDRYRSPGDDRYTYREDSYRYEYPRDRSRTEDTYRREDYRRRGGEGRVRDRYYDDGDDEEDYRDSDRQYRDDSRRRYRDPIRSEELSPLDRKTVRHDSITRDRDRGGDSYDRERTKGERTRAPLPRDDRYRDDDYDDYRMPPSRSDERDRIDPSRVKDDSYVSKPSVDRDRTHDRYPDEDSRRYDKDTRYYDDEERRSETETMRSISPSKGLNNRRPAEDRDGSRDDRYSRYSDDREYRTRLSDDRKDDTTRLLDERDDRTRLSDKRNDRTRLSDERTRLSGDRRDDRTRVSYVRDERTRLSDDRRDDRTRLPEEKRDDRRSLSDDRRDDRTRLPEEKRDDRRRLSDDRRDDRTRMSDERRYDRTRLSDDRDYRSRPADDRREYRTRLSDDTDYRPKLSDNREYKTRHLDDRDYSNGRRGDVFLESRSSSEEEDDRDSRTRIRGDDYDRNFKPTKLDDEYTRRLEDEYKNPRGDSDSSRPRYNDDDVSSSRKQDDSRRYDIESVGFRKESSSRDSYSEDRDHRYRPGDEDDRVRRYRPDDADHRPHLDDANERRYHEDRPLRSQQEDQRSRYQDKHSPRRDALSNSKPTDGVAQREKTPQKNTDERKIEPGPPLRPQDVIEAALRQPDTANPSGRDVSYPVFNPKGSNLTSPEIIRASERRGTTLNSRRKRRVFMEGLTI